MRRCAATPPWCCNTASSLATRRLRKLLATEFGVTERELMIAGGSLQLQDLVSAHLIRPGATVLTEQPSYDRAITTFRRRGAKTIGIPIEADGISIERLEAAIAKQVPAFLYLVPDFQNPAGVTLSLAKRRAIVELANRHGFWVIEDVPYRKLRYRGESLPLLREIDPSRIITMSSFSKLLSPGIRVGYMVAPAALVEAVTKLGEDTYLSPVLPTQAAVAEFIQRGWLEPNIERLKQLYRPRWEAMIGATRQLPRRSRAIRARWRLLCERDAAGWRQHRQPDRARQGDRADPDARPALLRRPRRRRRRPMASASCACRSAPSPPSRSTRACGGWRACSSSSEF